MYYMKWKYLPAIGIFFLAYLISASSWPQSLILIFANESDSEG